jgi:putative two-component system response regulator
MARILIVDDDISMRSVMKDCLSPIYEVFDTGEPESALAMTLEHKPDAILMDLSMPGLSGFELCRVLSSLSITQQIPIFIVSGEDERNRAFCQNLGATRFFTKPVDFTRLKADLDWVLRSKKADRRADPRIQIRVLLKLKGRDKEGNDFETRAETENMSRGGFLCACEVPLAVGASADVLLCGDREINLGHARVVRVERPDSLTPRYGFQFIKK